jgi:hypothetical protein
MSCFQSAAFAILGRAKFKPNVLCTGGFGSMTNTNLQFSELVAHLGLCMMLVIVPALFRLMHPSASCSTSNRDTVFEPFLAHHLMPF